MKNPEKIPLPSKSAMNTSFTPPLRWIWQHPAWPHFVWQDHTLMPLLREVSLLQGELLGRIKGSDDGLQAQLSLDAMLQNIIHSSSIEGEKLNVESVRSSLALRMDLPLPQTRRDARSEGLAQIMFDATDKLDAPLDLARLLQWHEWLFVAQEGAHPLLHAAITGGQLRGTAPMQVVSGRMDGENGRQTVHFEAPPRALLEPQLDAFLAWFNATDNSAQMPPSDPLLRAGIAHFWFVTLHPFEDGNGRLTRALTDLALAQGERQSIRLYAMSAAILLDRNGYYHILEQSQRLHEPSEPLDLTPWLAWFLKTLRTALQQALAQMERVLEKSRYWLQHRERGLSSEQVKVLNRLLDGDQITLSGQDRGGFVDGISASQYQKVAKVSKATATRHLADLVEKGCLVRLEGGGRSTRYKLG
jgi:Fic family protein